MAKLETLKENLNYVIHYVFEEDGTLDYVFISHSEKVFNQDVQILELTFDQFNKFPLKNDCYVAWGNDTMTTNQWIEYWTETNQIDEEEQEQGEFYAEYDEVEDVWCVFHTTVNPERAYNYYTSREEAWEDAEKRNEINA